MTATDLLLDANDDLLVERGDFVAGPADAQHIDLLLRTAQGDWRADPLVGVGIARYQKAPYGATQAAALTRAVGIQLERDGYQVLALDLTDLSDATIDADRP
ncbi:hypothetical protein LJ737_19950 [Hymenobacter sp. 15J16-1T3B]|uniref:hypothetical protein n=1 Tax=Hymenobacter sp. 15J16-1T3B TaxID=2886941 RepID=UPI001D0FAF4C|nr:hypothetical protein [Hymenobacter sp. 15J16-1T3B]MCC3159526.1 hypothetical protein [Hymenobacter sp. 15J16-1T3B]